MADIALLTPFLSLLFVVIGWGVVNYQNNERERRKEIRALVDKAKAECIAIAATAVKYYRKIDPADPTKNADGANELKSSLQALEIELERMKNFRINGGVSPLMNAYINFSESITNDIFESHSRTELKADADELKAIRRTRNHLIAELERQFRARFE
jgi:hypothetical protein